MEYKYLKAITEEGETTTLVVKVPFEPKLAYQLKQHGIEFFDRVSIDWDKRDIVFTANIEN